MLILVAVSVQVVINSDLIGTAEDAANRTELAYKNESNTSGSTIGNVYYNNPEEYVNSLSVELITFSIDGDEYKAPKGWTWLDFIGSSYDTSEGKLYYGQKNGYSIWYGAYNALPGVSETDPIEAREYTTVGAD